ncbi:carbohydrate-binding module family 5 protein [Trametes coccinea BRFM310]|uniref:chitinase n=1 Tax=Trametes coccinea (strain BRFM310) TaxID=1353009 RepID=A0A1Y2J528_TRAC3|nr:carbohydrate-binding module family 5 protein [Trametes coccinea BRFM310]
MALSSFMRRFCMIAAVALSALTLVNATEVMQRPPTYKNHPHNVTTQHKVRPHVVHKRASSGKVQAAYFTNWGIYGANFQPTDINPTPLTHIIYAFADVSPDTGTISLTDSWADEQKHYAGDSWNDVGNNLYGNLKQLYLLKLQNRNLKVVLSIGGWTYSQYGHFSFVTDSTKRATFVTSAVSLIENYGFDGIDIDFEYPSSTAQASGFASLLTSLRTAFDNLQAQKGDSTPYELSAAVPAGSDNYQWLNVPVMDKALTHWNLMAYDYAGSWLTYADNQANLYGGQRTNVSTDKAIKWYIANGATPSKINMGIPLYGRAFENTNGIGSSYSGIGPGTIEAGIYSYKVLPLAGATVYENLTDVTSYSYDSTKRELVSYDDPHIAQLKAQYVRDNGLGGSMFWDLSTDKNNSDSLVSTTAQVYGDLDQTLNHINYPNSKWDNIRNNMGQSTSSSTTSSRASTSTTSTRSSTSSSTTKASSTTTKASSTTTTKASSTTTKASSTTTKSTSTSKTSSSTTKRSSTSTVRSTCTRRSSTTSSRSSTTTSRATSTSTTTSASSTTTAGSGSGACAGIAAWSSTMTYVGGNQATYNGHLWTAKWWTYNDVPGGQAGVWTDNGSC